MKTTKLYQNDVYLKECECMITSVCHIEDSSASKGNYLITLDQTPFFPEGGGQSCDIGTIGDFPVTDVRETEGRVIHTVSAHGTDVPREGDRLTCRINWNRRFDNMQRHCGEHILSGSFHRLFGGVNRGFHMSNDYMTIDIALEKNKDFTKITEEMALAAELDANMVIWSDAPISIMHFDTREDAEKMPVRKAFAFDNDISIVRIGFAENIADCVACCGTHPSSTGQVGIIKIYKVEKYKNMSRIYFDAGRRAFENYRRSHKILTELADKYSSSAEDLTSRIITQENKLKSVKDELYKVKKLLISNECEHIDKTLQPNTSSLIVYMLKQFSQDDAFDIAKNYMGDKRKLRKRLLLLYAQEPMSCVLISDGHFHCGNIAKELLPLCNGKGGGNDVSARAIFTSNDDVKHFISLLQDKLK